MKRFLTLPGILGIALVISGLIFIYLGFTSEKIVDEFKIYWMFTFSALLLGIIISLHEKGIIVATYLSRIFVGSLFIVSGLIKQTIPKDLDINWKNISVNIHSENSGRASTITLCL